MSFGTMRKKHCGCSFLLRNAPPSRRSPFFARERSISFIVNRFLTMQPDPSQPRQLHNQKLGITSNIPEAFVSVVVQRSRFVTVLAWIFIAFSGFGTFISVLQNIMIQTVFNNPELDKAFHSSPPDVPPFALFMIGHMQLFFLAFLLFSVFMLVSSIGLLRRWNWARLCFIGLMVLTIVWQLVGLGIQFSMFSSIREQISSASAQGGPNMGAFVIAIGVVSILFALGFSVLFGWIVKKLMSAPIAAEFRG